MAVVVEIRVLSDRWVCVQCGNRVRAPHGKLTCRCGGQEWVQRVKMTVT